MSDNYISRYGPVPCQLRLKRVMSLKVGERLLVRILLVKHHIILLFSMFAITEVLL